MEHEEPSSSQQDNSSLSDENCLSPSVSRRDFLRTASLLGAGLTLGARAAGRATTRGTTPERPGGD